jgi:hypothetical protein
VVAEAAAEQVLGVQAVLDHRGGAPFGGDDGVVVQVPPAVIAEVLLPAVVQKWSNASTEARSRQRVITARSARCAAKRTPGNPGRARNIGSDLEWAKSRYSSARVWSIRVRQIWRIIVRLFLQVRRRRR